MSQRPPETLSACNACEVNEADPRDPAGNCTECQPLWAVQVDTDLGPFEIRVHARQSTDAAEKVRSAFGSPNLTEVLPVPEVQA